MTYAEDSNDEFAKLERMTKRSPSAAALPSPWARVRAEMSLERMSRGGGLEGGSGRWGGPGPSGGSWRNSFRDSFQGGVGAGAAMKNKSEGSVGQPSAGKGANTFPAGRFGLTTPMGGCGGMGSAADAGMTPIPPPALGTIDSGDAADSNAGSGRVESPGVVAAAAAVAAASAASPQVEMPVAAVGSAAQPPAASPLASPVGDLKQFKPALAREISDLREFSEAGACVSPRATAASSAAPRSLSRQRSSSHPMVPVVNLETASEQPRAQDDSSTAKKTMQRVRREQRRRAATAETQSRI